MTQASTIKISHFLFIQYLFIVRIYISSCQKSEFFTVQSQSVFNEKSYLKNSHEIQRTANVQGVTIASSSAEKLYRYTKIYGTDNKNSLRLYTINMLICIIL